MIETGSMVVFLCCSPTREACIVRGSMEQAYQHAEDRARVTGRRQRVRASWSRQSQGVWLVRQAEPSTWHFDGRTYRIVDTQS